MKIRHNKIYDAVGKDNSTKLLLDFKTTSEHLIESELTRTISQIDVFNNERNESDKYRLILNVNPVLTNVLTNVTGPFSLSSFNDERFKKIVDYRNEGGMATRSSIGYPESISVNFIEENGWVGYYDVKTLTKDCRLTELLPTKDYFVINDDNWVIKLFYLSDISEIDGLEFSFYEYVDYGGRSMVCLKSTFPHNLKIGDNIELFGTNKNGSYKIYDIGNLHNERREYFFVIELSGELTLGDNPYFNKKVNGYNCKYQQRKLTEINVEKPLVLEAGFSNNIYNDKTIQIIYQDTIDVGGLIDYRGRPITEIIAGIFKRSDKDGVEMFSKNMSGYSLKYDEYINHNSKYPNINLINEVSKNVTLDSDVMLFDKLHYDLIEFDTFNYQETILSNVEHRFNTLDRQRKTDKTLIDGSVTFDLGVRKEGYCYNPFLAIKILDESDVERTGIFDDTVYNSYEYDTNLFSGKKILKRSENSEIKYPFLNGVHYVEKRLNFFLKRQDPFGYSGLIHLSFPSDKIGKKNQLLKTEIKTEEPNDEC